MNPASLYKALMTDNKGFPTERERERERERESNIDQMVLLF
jgi:hypothetical protein